MQDQQNIAGQLARRMLSVLLLPPPLRRTLPGDLLALFSRQASRPSRAALFPHSLRGGVFAVVHWAEVFGFLAGCNFPDLNGSADYVGGAAFDAWSFRR